MSTSQVKTLYSTSRGDWGRKRFPERPVEAEVQAEAEGQSESPTFLVLARYANGETEVNLRGVKLATAKFNADCITGGLQK